MPVFADLIVAGVRQGEIRDKVISLPTVSAAHLFKQGLHKATAPFCVGFQRLYEFCSFPITAFQFTTNEPQSYVLGGRNHPLHINSWKRILKFCPSFRGVSAEWS